MVVVSLIAFVLYRLRNWGDNTHRSSSGRYVYVFDLLFTLRELSAIFSLQGGDHVTTLDFAQTNSSFFPDFK